MSTIYAGYSASVTGPSRGGRAITPSNDADLAIWVRAITIGSAGVIVYDNWDGVTCTTGALPVGTYALFARRVRATGTTATDLTGWE